MFEEDSFNRTIVSGAAKFPDGDTKFPLQESGATAAKSIHDLAGAAAVVIVELSAWAFQETVVVEQLQPPQKVLRTVADEGKNVGRTEKTMPMNQINHFTVARG